jgi:transposase-like protein
MKQESTLKNVESIICFDTLETLARTKIQGFMQSILEEEVDYFLGRLKYERCSQGKVDQGKGLRNGHGKPRKFGMMSGTVIVRRPRLRGLEERFESKVLPLFKRRTKSIDGLLPDLYLHGLASGDFEMAMRGLLGDGAPLSASSIIKLKGKWTMEYDLWKKSDLSGLELVYCWADGLYVKAGLEDRKAALLVIIGADKNGDKHLVACESGERESKESWLKILRDLKARGLKLPKVTVADGALGLWSALGELHPEGEEQRCWNHKITNVLDDLNKKEQPAAAELLKLMPYAETKKECEILREEFADIYKKIAPKAVETLKRDWDRMVTFYSFPKEHWKHLRTSNIVESPFSAVRLRTDASRRFKKVEGAKAMIWKLLQVAERNWNKLSRPDLMGEVYDGKKFEDGLPLKANRCRQL